MVTLHDRIFAIYDCIEKYQKRHGQAPSVKEIAIAVDCETSTVSTTLKKMGKLGMIDRPEGKARAITLLSRQPNWTALME